MKYSPIVIIALLSLVVTGCATAPIQTAQTRASVFNTQYDSSYLLKQALSASQQWETTKNIKHLITAHQFYTQGLALRPDDLNFQRGHYMASFKLALKQQLSADTVDTLYTALHPHLKKQVPPPSRLEYIEAKRHQRAAADIYGILLSSLQKQPRDDYLWGRLSLAAEDYNLPWLAAASAFKAATLNNTDAHYLVQSSDMLSQIYDQSLCGQEHTTLQQQILKRLLKADKLAPNKTYIQAEIAFNYARAGLMPLAIKYAKQAYDIKANAWNAYMYSYTLFYNQRYDAAQKIGLILLNDLDTQSGLDVLTVVELALGNITQAADYARQLKTGYEGSATEQLTWNWVISLSDPSYTPAHIADIKASALVTQDILNYLKFGKGDILEARADAPACERSVTYFANAIQQWHAGDRSKAAEYFKRAKTQRHALYADYDASLASLQGLTF